MYNFSCLLVCNLTCVRLERAFGGVPTVAKLSVKLITQYVEITLGSEIVFYGRFHRFCSCQRLSLARLQGSTCQKKSNKTWKLKRHLDTQNFSFLDHLIHWNIKQQSTKVQSLSFKSWLLWRFCNPCQVLLFLSAMVPSHSLILEEWWTRAKLMRLSGLCIEIILSCCMCTGHDKSSDHQRIFTLTLICQPSKLLIPLINLLSFIYPPIVASFWDSIYDLSIFPQKFLDWFYFPWILSWGFKGWKTGHKKRIIEWFDNI